ARESLTLARENDDEEHDALCYLGDILSCQGRVAEARQAFAEARAILKRTASDDDELTGEFGTDLANLLLHINQIKQARDVTIANLHWCQNKRYFGDVARCQWILGCADTAEGQLDQA